MNDLERERMPNQALKEIIYKSMKGNSVRFVVNVLNFRIQISALSVVGGNMFPTCTF